MQQVALTLCECGCGTPTIPAAQTDARDGLVKGQPRRFIRGHHARTDAVRKKLREARSSPEVRAALSELNLRHGHASRGGLTPTYTSWAAMKNRCTNPNAADWHRYGGRGITICERWRVFENFLADMGERPEGRSIDRIDNEGNYEPSNCRWATRKEQRANQRPRIAR